MNWRAFAAQTPDNSPFSEWHSLLEMVSFWDVRRLALKSETNMRPTPSTLGCQAIASRSVSG